jgi:hypothetical protein
MQDVRIIEHPIRTDDEPVDGTGWLPIIDPRLTLSTESAVVDTSNNQEITPQEYVVVPHRNVRSRLHMLFAMLHLNSFLGA